MPERTRRGKLSGRKLSLALLSTVLACLAAELGLRYLAHRANRETIEVAFRTSSREQGQGRVALAQIIRPSGNDRIIYELIPGLQGVSFKKAELSTDEHGFRRTGRPDGPTSDRTLCIFGLGDSIMFGHGISDGETYLSLLQERLGELLPELDVRVYNSGVPGYNTVQEVETLRTKGLAFEPDLVILDLVPNDLSLPPYIRSEVDAVDPRRSFLVDLVRSKLGDIEPQSHFIWMKEVAPSAETWERQPDLSTIPERYHPVVGREAFEGALDDLVVMREHHGFDLIAFTAVEFVEPMPLIMEAVRARGIPVISILEDQRAHVEAHSGQELSVQGLIESSLVVSKGNLHPSSTAHDIAAQRILANITRRGLLERLLSKGQD